MQGAVAQPLGLEARQLAAQEQDVGQGERAAGRSAPAPSRPRSSRSRAKGSSSRPHRLRAANAVLAAGAGAMLALQMSGLALAVGEDRLEAVPVRVGEGELRAGVRALAAHDQPRALPASRRGRSGRWPRQTSPFSRAAAVLGERRDPAPIGNRERSPRAPARSGRSRPRSGSRPRAPSRASRAWRRRSRSADTISALGGDLGGQLLERLVERPRSGRRPCWRRRCPAAGARPAAPRRRHRRGGPGRRASGGSRSRS